MEKFKAIYVAIHRLTAFAFIKRPDDPKYVVVDHIKAILWTID